MIKHNFQSFLDKLKVDSKQVAVEHLLSQLNVRPGLDLYSLRPKIEELFRDGLGINTTGYLEMIKGKAITDEIKNWSAQTLHVLSEKYLEIGKHAELVAFIKTHHEKLSSIKVTDLLKRVLILENNELASALVRSSLETRHKESRLVFSRLHRYLHQPQVLGPQKQRSDRHAGFFEGSG